MAILQFQCGAGEFGESGLIRARSDIVRDALHNSLSSEAINRSRSDSLQVCCAAVN